MESFSRSNAILILKNRTDIFAEFSKTADNYICKERKKERWKERKKERYVEFFRISENVSEFGNDGRESNRFAVF